MSGVGPKGALGILSVLSPNDLRTAVLSQDAKAISKSPGIGTKTAQKIIIDLKDKVSIDDIVPVDDMPVADGALNVSGAKNDAIEALTALGYSVKEAKSAVMKVEDDENYTVEDHVLRWH